MPSSNFLEWKAWGGGIADKGYLISRVCGVEEGGFEGFLSCLMELSNFILVPPEVGGEVDNDSSRVPVNETVSWGVKFVE